MIFNLNFDSKMKNYLLLTILFTFIFSTKNYGQELEYTDPSISNIIKPNDEIRLFYGSNAFSCDEIVMLKNHTIIYDKFNLQFILLDNQNRQILDKFNFKDIKKLRTSRIRHVTREDNKLIYTYETPTTRGIGFNGQIDLYSNSDTSANVGVIKIKRTPYLFSIYVSNNKLHYNLEEYIPKKLFTEKYNKRKVKLDYYKAIGVEKFASNKTNIVIAYRVSPYIGKKLIREENNSARDSIFNYDAIYVKEKGTNKLKLINQVDYNTFHSIHKKRGRFVFDLNLIRTYNQFVFYSSTIDNLIIYDDSLNITYQGKLRHYLPNLNKYKINYKIKREDTSYYNLQIYKDEFTNKLYGSIWHKQGEDIYQININNNTPSFKFLRTIKIDYNDDYFSQHVVSINKGKLYVKLYNPIAINYYIYEYDLYKGIKNNDKVLEFAYKEVNKSSTKYAKYKERTSPMVAKNELAKLSKKQIRKYFPDISRLDTATYKQDSIQNLLKSILKLYEQKNYKYPFAYLYMYDGLLQLEISDDMKQKNYLFFDDFTVEEEIISRNIEFLKYLLEHFGELQFESMGKKLACKTPDGLICYFIRIDGLWYLSATMTKVVED